MLEFTVNKYITLKLEDEKVNIYVKGDLFRQCKFLLLNIPIKKISSFDEIDSVDEVSGDLGKDMEGNEAQKFQIPPEVEFWAHSSNLHMWAEQNYDTRLLHSKLAFPLLKRLTEVEDPIAIRVLKEEIAKRLKSGYAPVIEFLKNERYIDFLSREEFLNSVLGYDEQGQKEVEFLLRLEEVMGHEFDLEKECYAEYNNFVVKNEHIVELSIYTEVLDINKVLPLIGGLTSLRILFIFCQNLTKFPESFSNLTILEYLDAQSNNISMIPWTMKKLKNLKKLNLYDNYFTEVPKVIGEFAELEELDLSMNQIRGLPNEIEKLKNLKILNLGENKLIKLPKFISDFSLLERFILTKNKLKHVPKELGELKNLRFLSLMENDFNEFPKTICELKSLESLHLARNQLKYVPQEIKKLRNLKFIGLSENNLSEFPQAICGLKSLESLNLARNQLREIPKEILGLKNLKSLDLKGNRLQHFPQFIEELPKLEFLDIKNNNLKNNSTFILKLKKKGIKIRY